MEKELAQRAVTGTQPQAGTRAVPRAGKGHGLAISRYFTTLGVDPADELAWELRSASITGEDGKIVFEQKNIEVPKTWSMLATNVVASKYFRGQPGTPMLNHTGELKAARWCRRMNFSSLRKASASSSSVK